MIAVLGPTGSGKSGLAVALALQFRGEIVNCDSVQVYRWLDIGSAKLPEADRRGIPHHLLDILDLGQELTAGAYVRLARPALTDISSRNRLPILVGGTGFYLRALLDGLSPAPGRDPALRARLAGLAQRKPAALYRFLRWCDPAAAARIHANDHQKLGRAIELALLSGRAAAQAQPAHRDRLQGYSVLKIGLAPDRKELYRRLDLRSMSLFEDGLLEETSAVLGCGIGRDSKPLSTLGYKQAVAVLTGDMSLPHAISECQTKTRQYAKRQMTWFRREADVHWLSGFGTDAAVRNAALALGRDFTSRSAAAP